MKRCLLILTFCLSVFCTSHLTAVQAAPLIGATNAAGGSWSFTGSLRTARVSPMAATLPNGDVLAAGGFNNATFASAELFDPLTGIWSQTGAIN
jgi:hypothetical protein